MVNIDHNRLEQNSYQLEDYKQPLDYRTDDEGDQNDLIISPDFLDMELNRLYTPCVYNITADEFNQSNL